MTENPSFVLWVVSESNLPRQAQTGTLRELRKTEIALRADGALTAILALGIEPIALRSQSTAAIHLTLRSTHRVSASSQAHP